MRLLRESSIRCTTSECALPVITLGRLDHDWYEVRTSAARLLQRPCTCNACNTYGTQHQCLPPVRHV